MCGIRCQGGVPRTLLHNVPISRVLRFVMRLRRMQSEFNPDVGADRGADGTANVFPVLVTDGVSDIHANFNAHVCANFVAYDNPNDSADTVSDVYANTWAVLVVCTFDGSN
jgi:hypothetical protein